MRGGAWAWALVLGGVALGDANRGLVLATLVPRVEAMRGGEAWRGAAVAAFSAGRLVATPLVGSLSWEATTVLAWSAGVACLGNAAYAASKTAPSVVLSRFVVGLGASCLGLCRAFVAANTSPASRTSAMAGLGALQFFGFTATSGFALVVDTETLDPLDLPGLILISLYGLYLVGMVLPWTLLLLLGGARPAGHVDQERTPLEALTAPLLPQTDDAAEDADEGVSSEDNGVSSEDDGVRSEDDGVDARTSQSLSAAVWRAVGVNVAVRSLLGVLETLGAGVLSASYGGAVDAGGASRRSSTIFWGIGCAGTAVHGAVHLLASSKLLTDEGMLTGGLACMALGHGLLAIPSVSRSTPAQVAALALAWAVGYPFATSTMLANLSREMEGCPRLGAAMSLVAWAGSSARVAAPLLAGLLYDGGEGRAVFATCGALGMLVTLAVAPSSRTHTPAPPGRRQQWA